MNAFTLWLHFSRPIRIMKPEAFTIRVYGVLTDEVKGVLVSDEQEQGRRFTKFPGGGLELGEGTKDCLRREWREELGQEISVTDHLYTTDFFQPSAFHADRQVISIYYFVQALSDAAVKTSIVPFDFSSSNEVSQSFRWIEWNRFTEDALTLPIDKIVAIMILEKRRRR